MQARPVTYVALATGRAGENQRLTCSPFREIGLQMVTVVGADDEIHEWIVAAVSESVNMVTAVGLP